MPYRAPAGATIEFPGWVKITRCEQTSQLELWATAHGQVRTITHTPTHHGRVMDVWRARKAEACEQTAVGDRSLPMVVPRAETSRPRVHAGASPGRYAPRRNLWR